MPDRGVILIQDPPDHAASGEEFAGRGELLFEEAPGFFVKSVFQHATLGWLLKDRCFVAGAPDLAGTASRIKIEKHLSHIGGGSGCDFRMALQKLSRHPAL